MTTRDGVMPPVMSAEDIETLYQRLQRTVAWARKNGAGLWDVLHELARGRTASGMERERRATLSMLMRRLPDRRVQVEDVTHGRRMVIGERAGTPNRTR